MSENGAGEMYCTVPQCTMISPRDLHSCLMGSLPACNTVWFNHHGIHVHLYVPGVSLL